MSDQIKSRTCGLISRIIGCSVGEIQDNTLLQKDLGYDSISIIELQVEIEDEFGFLFDVVEDDFDKIFYSLENLCQYINNRLKA